MAIGDIGGVIKSLEFETNIYDWPDIIHIAGNVYAIAGRGPLDYGSVRTFTISDDGTAIAEVDSLWFDTVRCTNPRIIHIAGSVYAIVYLGPDNDGWLKTFTISDSGTAIAEVASLEFDTDRGETPSIIHVSGNIYAIAYKGPDSGWLKTVSISDDGLLLSLTGSSLEFDIGYYPHPVIIHISGNVYAIVYQGPDYDGWLKTVYITDAGSIGAIIASLEFDIESCYYPDIIHISGNVYAIVYRNYAAPEWIYLGLLKTVSISDNGLTLSVIASFEFDPVGGNEPDIIHIARNVYAIAYKGPDNDGWLKTFTIADDGTAMTEVASLEFDTDRGGWPKIIPTSGNVYAIAYEGSEDLDELGWLKTVDIERLSTPIVSTDPATEVEKTTASLNGTLDDDGNLPCECGFEWGKDVPYGNTTPTESKTTGQTFSQPITGLKPKTTYRFRAFAINSKGTSYGTVLTFTTPAGLPTITTNPATGTSTLNATLDDDGGEACECGFEWGETEAYGNTTPTQSRRTGQNVLQTIGELLPDTTYHFRAFATNSSGTGYGADRTFTTPAALPTVTTNPATALSAIAATPNGKLDSDGGEVCQCGFEWGLDTGYGYFTSTKSKTTGQTFSEVIGGLEPGTIYHFRAFATNSVGTSYGADRTFTTALVISRAFALAREEL